MVPARALLSGLVVAALSSHGRQLLKVFTPGQVLSIHVPPDKKNPNLPQRVSVTVVDSCSKGVYDCAFLYQKKQWRSDRLAKVTQCANDEIKYKDPSSLTWVLAVSWPELDNLASGGRSVWAQAVVGAVMAFGIGANDAANSWATTVGSGALPLTWACLIGGVMEWAGATALGYGVAGTLRRGVASTTSPDCWACGYCNSKMTIYMVAMMSALFAAAIFMMLACFTAMPVSTTHAIVGGVVGATVAANNFGCLNWSFVGGGLSAIAASWVLSPLAAGVLGAIAYFILLFTVFKRKGYAMVQAAIIAIPICYAVTTWVTAFMILIKAPATKKVPMVWSALLALACAGVVSVLVIAVILPRMKRNLPSVVAARELEKKAGGEEAARSEAVDKLTKRSIVPELDPKVLSTQSYQVKEEHAEQQSIEERDATWCFRYVLAYQAALESFAHGANDTANATGALTSVYQMYREGMYACSQDSTPWYIMTAGGIFVGIGVFTFGYRVMKTVGSDLTDVNFFRGYCMEMASTVTVVVATFINMPVSTTQIQVGAVVFIGIFAFGFFNVKWSLVARIFATWVFTIPLAAVIGAFLTWVFTYAVRI